MILQKRPHFYYNTKFDLNVIQNTRFSDPCSAAQSRNIRAIMGKIAWVLVEIFNFFCSDESVFLLGRNKMTSAKLQTKFNISTNTQAMLSIIARICITWEAIHGYEKRFFISCLDQKLYQSKNEKWGIFCNIKKDLIFILIQNLIWMWYKNCFSDLCSAA